MFVHYMELVKCKLEVSDMFCEIFILRKEIKFNCALEKYPYMCIGCSDYVISTRVSHWD